MTRHLRPITIASLIATALLLVSATTRAADCASFLDHDFKKLHSSQSINLGTEFAGRPLHLVRIV